MYTRGALEWRWRRRLRESGDWGARWCTASQGREELNRLCGSLRWPEAEGALFSATVPVFLWDAAGGDARFAAHTASVGQRGDKMNVGKRGRKDSAADGQDFAAFPNRFGEIAGDVGERGKKEIAEVVADQAASGVETILEQAAEQGFVLGKRDHAIANIARGKNAIFAAQAAGAAAVIGDGDDGGEIRNGRSAFGFLSSPRTTCSLRPRSRVDKPVPPPSATMRNPREKFPGLTWFFFTYKEIGRNRL